MNNQPNQASTQIAQPPAGTIPAADPAGVTPDATLDVGVPNQERIDLEAELQAYKDKDLATQQQDMSEDQKEIDELKKQLHDLAKKPLLESGYYKESDLAKYNHGEVKAMNDLLTKMGVSGAPSAPNRAPKVTEKKKLLRNYDNATDTWTE